MRSYARRVDPETGGLHMRVAHEADYAVDRMLYRRLIGNGIVTCRLLKSDAAGARGLVQLVAEYSDAGVLTTQVSLCESEDDEIRQLSRLEKIILAASRRPTRP